MKNLAAVPSLKSALIAISLVSASPVASETIRFAESGQRTLDVDLTQDSSQSVVIEFSRPGVLQGVLVQDKVDLVLSVTAPGQAQPYILDDLDASQDETFWLPIEPGTLRVEISRKDPEARILRQLNLDFDDQPGEPERLFAQAKELGYQASEIRRARRRDQFERAADLERRALGIWRTLGEEGLSGESHLRLATTLRAMGQVEDAIIEYQQAREAYRRAGDTKSEAVSLHNLGVTYEGRANLEEAQQAYERARSLVARGSRGWGFSTMNLAGIKRKLGDLDASQDLAMEVLGSDHGWDLRQTGRTYLLMAANAFDQADYWGARRNNEKAVDLLERSGDDILLANALQNLATFLTSVGDNWAAIEVIQESMPLWQKAGSSAGESVAMKSLGGAHAALGNTDEAIKTLRRAIEIANRAENGYGEAESQRLLGGLVRGKEGRTLLNQSLDYFEETKQEQGMAQTLLALVELELESGLTSPEAKLRIERAMEVARSIGNQLLVERALRARSRLHSLNGDWDLAYTDSQRAVELLDNYTTQIASLTGRAQFREKLGQLRDLLLEISMNLDSQETGQFGSWDNFWLTDASKALLLRELLAYRTETTADPADDQWRSKLSSAQLRWFQEGDPSTAADIALATRQHARSQEPISPLELVKQVPEDVRRSIPEDLAIVEFVLSDKAAHAFVLTRMGLKVVELGRDSSAQELDQLRTYLSERPSRIRGRLQAEAVKRVASSYWMPIESELARLEGDEPTFTRIALVPDGILYRLPLGWLREQACATDCRQRTLARIPSFAVAREVPIAPESDSKILIWADPVFSEDDSRLAKAKESVGQGRKSGPLFGTGSRSRSDRRLPFSRDEAESIAAIAGARATTFTDFKANRETLASNAQGAQYLHFATHAVAHANSPTLSGLVLSMVDEEERAVDGFLDLFELAELDLQAELVTLSACSTALGAEIKGEGVVGVSYGFFAAGARKTLTSLWPIEDEAAAVFMKVFYKNLIERRMRKAEALRETQEIVGARPEYRHPHYWAGWVLQSIDLNF